MVNQLFISTVTRDYYGSKLECRARGSDLVEPIVKEVTVQVHCKCELNAYQFLFSSNSTFSCSKTN